MSSEAFVQTIKQIAVGAVATEKLSSLVIGKVYSVSPLQIELDNVGLLSGSKLSFIEPITSSGVVDTSVSSGMTSTGSTTVSGTAGGEIEVEVKDSSNTVIGKAKGSISLPVSASDAVTVSGSINKPQSQTVTVNEHWLQAGDIVALLRYSGGAKFLVLGKIRDA